VQPEPAPWPHTFAALVDEITKLKAFRVTGESYIVGMSDYPKPQYDHDDLALQGLGRRNDEDLLSEEELTEMIAKTKNLLWSQESHQKVALGSLEGNLPELLASFIGDGRRHYLIAELDPYRYVQYLVTEKDEVITECVSNRNQHAEHLFSESELEAIENLGFRPPVDGDRNRPNYAHEGQGMGAIFPAAVLGARVMREIFGLHANATLSLTRNDAEIAS